MKLEIVRIVIISSVAWNHRIVSDQNEFRVKFESIWVVNYGSQGVDIICSEL